ncbi:hypothetical protein ColLi_05649 [Colletotrichum liriopes]|uniref:Uncharacterized protein n=1 Tax=Colletotrichum liriopes TaxID=708192 RepID=A0AA37LSN8_9PEZI|nr:hypothetical protein ColLi_05649 [Colletotrichum liriopes]
MTLGKHANTDQVSKGPGWSTGITSPKTTMLAGAPSTGGAKQCKSAGPAILDRLRCSGGSGGLAFRTSQASGSVT